MCIFKKKPAKPTLAIPHPEEPVIDPAKADITTARLKWLTGYNVPTQHWQYWMDVGITLNSSVPAEYTYNTTDAQCIEINPPYCNAGVIAHSVAHIVYSRLEDKAGFMVDLVKAKTEPLVMYLFQHHTYGLSSEVEAHAEIYRYLGASMPEYLRQYYPNLF